MPEQPSLQAVRARIDELDAQIQELIAERARSALQAAAAKQTAAGSAPLYRPEREAQVLRQIRARNRGPLDDAVLARVFREIMSACMALEKPLTVAFAGTAGSHAHAAVLQHFGRAAQSNALASLADVVREVEAAAADFGLLPVTNLPDGYGDAGIEQLLRSSLAVCGETLLPDHYHLLTPERTLAGIRRVYAPPAALAHCSGWLGSHLPATERIAVPSAAEAARLTREDTAAAAVAGQYAAEIFALPVLVYNIEDEPGGHVRFLVVGTQVVGPSGNDKTSLLLATHSRGQLLQRILRAATGAGVDIARLAGWPLRGGGDWLYFLDFEGHREEPPVQAALAELEQGPGWMRILGSYPSAGP